MEGHTEKGFKPDRVNHGAWEISTDLAQLIRRRLIENGVNESQIVKVTDSQKRVWLEPGEIIYVPERFF